MSSVFDAATSHARRYRGSRYMPGPGVVGVVLPAPLHAVRVRQGSRQRSRWSRCHAPCWGAPGVPLRCVVGDAPHLSRAVLHPLPLRGIGHVPRQLLRGCQCRTLLRQRASPSSPLSRLGKSPCHRPPTGYVTELAGQVLRQALRLSPRATVIGHADAVPRFPKP